MFLLKFKPLNLVDLFIFLGSNSSTFKRYINVWISKRELTGLLAKYV